MTDSDRPLLGAWALVASGDRRLRDRARVGLGGAGMLCDDVETARDAIDRLESMRHDYAVVVIDMDLADRAASDVESAAAAAVPAADIIRCDAPRAGPVDGRGAWISKPVRAADFGRVVHALRAWA